MLQDTRSIYRILFYIRVVMNNPKMKWRKTVSFTIASKSAKLKLWKLQNIIGIKGLNKWKDTTHSWIRILDRIKVASLPTLIYRLNTIPFNVPGDFFAEIVNLILNFIKIFSELRRAKTVFKKNKTRGLTHPGFKIYQKATVIKSVVLA